MDRRAVPRASPALALFLLAALAVGLAAALLAGPLAPAVPGSSGSSAPGTLPQWALQAFAVAVFGGIFAWLGYRIWLRIRGATEPYPGRLVSAALAVLLLLLLFLVAARFVGGSGPSSTPVVPAPPTTNGSTPPPTTNHTGGLPPYRAGGFSLPGWVLFAGLAGVAIVLVVLLAPALRREPRPADERRNDVPSARSAIASTLKALEDDPAADPRALIIALYARLLVRLSPGVPDLDVRTPRELEAVSVGRLGLSQATAEQLTRLFEEARYSTHPLPREAGERARGALQRALEELDRPRGVRG